MKRCRICLKGEDEHRKIYGAPEWCETGCILGEKHTECVTSSKLYIILDEDDEI
jgi:hypothetical protein